MEIITGWDIYWITRLDGIVGASKGVVVICFVICFTSAFLYIASRGSYDNFAEFLTEHGIKLITRSFIIGLLALAVFIFTPTSKQMAMIKVIPAIANNEDIQGEVKEVYVLAKQGLKELINTNKEVSK